MFVIDFTTDSVEVTFEPGGEGGPLAVLRTQVWGEREDTVLFTSTSRRDDPVAPQITTRNSDGSRAMERDLLGSGLYTVTKPENPGRYRSVQVRFRLSVVESATGQKELGLHVRNMTRPLQWVFDPEPHGTSTEGFEDSYLYLLGDPRPEEARTVWEHILGSEDDD